MSAVDTLNDYSYHATMQENCELKCKLRAEQDKVQALERRLAESQAMVRRHELQLCLMLDSHNHIGQGVNAVRGYYDVVHSSDMVNADAPVVPTDVLADMQDTPMFVPAVLLDLEISHLPYVPMLTSDAVLGRNGHAPVRPLEVE